MLHVSRGWREPIVLERIVNAFENNNKINGYDNNTQQQQPFLGLHRHVFIIIVALCVTHSRQTSRKRFA